MAEETVMGDLTEVEERLVVREKFVAAFDCGNAKTKRINNTSTNEVFRGVHPSVIKVLFGLPSFSKEDLDSAIAKLDENILVHITSEAIDQNGLYAFGAKADKVKDGFIRNMNIEGGLKSTDDIPVIATLASLATDAIKNQYKKSKTLPDEISLNVEYSTALPYGEYTEENARNLANRYLDNMHIVDVYVTKKPVHVRIKFVGAQVTQEGNPVVFVLTTKRNDDFFDEFNKKYNINWTNKEFIKLKILHIDIGDGTVEYIYTENGVPNADLSRGENRGVGHAAENAIKLFLQKTKQSLALNRQQFMKYVLDSDHRFNNDAVYAMKQADYTQSLMILEDVKNIYSNVLRGDVDLITVSGGGACEFRSSLEDKLEDYAVDMGLKVFWFPEDIASNVNTIGLDILNKNLFYRDSFKG